MAMKIDDDECISCGDCVTVCPSDAISEGMLAYDIDVKKCTECEDEADTLRCVETCPVSDCIVAV